MSLPPRLRRAPRPAPLTSDGSPTPDGPGRWRRGAAAVLTALAFLLVLGALVAPNEFDKLTPGAFARIPLEGLLAVALLLALPPRLRRWAVPPLGVLLGLLVVLKVVDMGFFMVLARPFDLVFDWPFLKAGVEFLTESYGRSGAIGAVIGAALLALVVLVVMTLAVWRVARVTAARETTATRAVATLTVVWVALAAFGVQVAPGAPLAADSAATLAHDRWVDIRTGLRDRELFAAGVSVDAFAGTPGEQLLTGLRGKDVLLSFVESYGRVAVEHPEIAPQIDALLDEGTRKLRAAGFDSRSAFLTSPTAGGGSWLAHATLLSGMWAENQQNYVDLISSDRLTLNGAFRRAGWRSVIVMPALTRAWPEGEFFDTDQIYGPEHLGYRGPKFGFAPVPDQYTLEAFQRLERTAADRAPVMAEIALVSSHAPWTPSPQLVDWTQLGDGSIFGPMAPKEDEEDTDDDKGDTWKDPALVRAEYRASIANSLESLITYVQTYGDDDMVLVFLGDHQPAPLVTGSGAGRDVPVTIVARDPAVLKRITGWGWQEGLNPGPQAPVWPMNEFRDAFLRAF
nr:sulfatase [Micromonospora sp. DSM 115978]